MQKTACIYCGEKMQKEEAEVFKAQPPRMICVFSTIIILILLGLFIPLIIAASKDREDGDCMIGRCEKDRH